MPQGGRSHVRRRDDSARATRGRRTGAQASENRQEFDRALATFAHPRYELVPTGEVYDGAEEVARYYVTSRAAFPDQQNELRALHHAGDVVVVEFDLMGTHTGPFHGLPPTGRTFTCPMVALFFFRADRIVCERVYFDAATILRQLGIGAPS